MSEILAQLNDKQREAVIQTKGPVLVLAGAGSGKTRALTFRIAYLIKEKKILPRNILAVTFTNKAAGEMLDRVKELLGMPLTVSNFSQSLPHMGTFHSICVRIIKEESQKIGRDKNFAIYDDQDQLSLVKRVLKQLDIDNNQIKPQVILSSISSAKNKLLGALDFQKQAEGYFEEIVSKAYYLYEEKLKEANALDFDDLIFKTVQMLNKNKEVLKKYQELFQYIMVDEYQDTNHAQYTLLNLLAVKHQNICVVGDDWQSIYGWRGANVENILNFEKDYPKAKVVLLEQNYRSTQVILDAAHQVISQNKNKKDKKLWTENSQGDLITVFQAGDEREEANFVAEKINEIKKENQDLKFDNFAVLYRTNAQSRALEEIFLKRNIPYRIVGGLKFYQRKEIKDVLAYIYLINNFSDRIAFERVVNLPKRGIGQKTVEGIVNLSSELGVNLIETINLILNQDEILSQVRVKIPTLSEQKSKNLKTFVDLISLFNLNKDQLKISELISKVYKDSGCEKILLKQGEEGQARNENVRELLTVANQYDEDKKSLEVFLEEIALISQVDRDLEAEASVPLMTMHSAKGLEYDYIFIIGVEEGIIPHSRSKFNPAEMEEERRLCYVGITRAKKKAFMLYTRRRNIFGSTQVSIKSRFLEEIDSDLLEQLESFDDFYEEDNYYSGKSSVFNNQVENSKTFFNKNFKKRKKEDVKNLESKNKLKLRDGDRIEHEDFGQGIVISIDKGMVSVVFPRTGIKKFVIDIAPIRKV